MNEFPAQTGMGNCVPALTLATRGGLPADRALPAVNLPSLRLRAP